MKKFFCLCVLFLVMLFFASCAASHVCEIAGKTVIVTNDTTVITHGGDVRLTVR